MLILTRREKEVIRINDDIQIIVHKIRGNQVGIGIVAPKDVVVLREELHGREREVKDPAPDTVIKVKKKRVNLANTEIPSSSKCLG